MYKIFASLRLPLLLIIVFITSSVRSQTKVDSLLLFLKSNQEVVASIADTGKIKAMNALADEYWHLNEYAKSINYALEAKAACEKLLESASKNIRVQALLANSFSNLGVANDYKGNYPEALSHFLNALKISEQIKDNHGIANALNNLGIIYFEQQNFQKALDYYNRALLIQEQTGDKEGVSFSLNNIGLVYTNMHNPEKALEYYFRSLKIKEKSGDDSGIESALLNIGGVYFEKGDYDKALDYMFQAVKINRKRGDELDYARLLNNIGTTYHTQKKYKEALDYCMKGLGIARELGALEYISSSEKELSEIYSEINDYKNAFKHYQSYITIKDSLFNEENTAELVRSEMNFDFEKKQAVAKAEQEKKDAISAGELKAQRMQRNYFIAGFILMIALALFIFKGYNEKKRTNSIIAEQKAIVEEKNKDITDSINYARRIQTAILPSLETIRLYLPQSFVFYQPKDIVSGDFYWFTEKEDRLIFAVADCTGHGVPGAFMSMIGNDILTQIIIEKGYLQPGQILTKLHEGVKNALKQDIGTGETKDGMDIALISIHKKDMLVEYAGALRPLWLIKTDAQEVNEYKADKHSIGGSASTGERIFTNHTIQINDGDSLYLSTDGFADQFGGEKGKKFMSKNMKNLLLKIQDKDMEEQKRLLHKSFSEWKMDRGQVDDILVVGIRL